MSAHADNHGNLSRSYLKTLILTVNFLFLTACSVPTTITITNVSSDNIVILVRGENGEINSFLLPKNKTIEIKSLLDKHFSISRRGQNLSYGVETIPEEFISNSGFGPFYKRNAKAEFDFDGCINLIAITKNPSRSKHMTQPQGFPLCPKNPTAL